MSNKHEGGGTMAYVRVVAEVDAKIGEAAKEKARKKELAMNFVIEQLLLRWTKGEVELWSS